VLFKKLKKLKTVKKYIRIFSFGFIKKNSREEQIYYSYPIYKCISCFLKRGNQQKNKNLKYPETTKKPSIEEHFGTKVTDNYRWLEDDRSKKTENWVKAENEVTFNI
jgi:prolyl oligopeptidase